MKSAGGRDRTTGDGDPGTHWLELTVRLPPRGEEILLAEALRRLGARGLERLDDRIVSYLLPPADLSAFLAEAEAVVRASTSLRSPALTWRRLRSAEDPEMWGRPIQRRRIGERILVMPHDDSRAVGAGTIPVRLRPGPAFGSSDHGTTRGCLRLLQTVSISGREIADVGAGSGILSIAAALLGARRVTAFERDPPSVAALRGNLVENAVCDRVSIREETAGPAEIGAAGPFHGIAANIATGTILSLLPVLGGALAPGGWLIVSGVPGGERALVRRAALDRGAVLSAEVEDDGWWAALFERPPSGETGSRARSDGTATYRMG